LKKGVVLSDNFQAHWLSVANGIGSATWTTERLRTVFPPDSGSWAYTGGQAAVVERANQTLLVFTAHSNTVGMGLAVTECDFANCGGAINDAGSAKSGDVAVWDGSRWTALARAVFNTYGDASAYAIAVSGDTVYVGGRFASIGGQARNKIAALDATTGLATSWDPNAHGYVYSLAASGTTIYAGGSFSSIGGQTRNRIAALDAATGLATAWNPDADDAVGALAVSGTTLYAGGAFTTIGGRPQAQSAHPPAGPRTRRDRDLGGPARGDAHARVPTERG
jgi:hypothetical protein